MDPIKAVVTPANQGNWQGRGRVQVVAVVPIGGVMKYVTLQVVNRKGPGEKWLGYNPDKEAVAQLNRAEQVEAESAHMVKALARDLDYWVVRLEENKAAAKAEGADKKALSLDRRTFNGKRKETALKLAEAEKVAAANKATADELRGKITRMIEVVF